MNKKPNLNLNRQNIPKNSEADKPMTQEEAAKAMASFYNTMENCLLNLVAIQNDMAKSIREISTDSSLLIELMGKRALKDEWITPVEHEEMFGDTDEDEDDDKEKPANAE